MHGKVNELEAAIRKYKDNNQTFDPQVCRELKKEESPLKKGFGKWYL